MKVVYIPTIDRADNLRKVVPYWIEQGFHVRLVIEPYEKGIHNALKRSEDWGADAYILPTPQARRGIGYVRNFCVWHAKRTNQASVVMSDDDIFVDPRSDATQLLTEAERPGVLGIGGVRSIHDMFTNGAISRNHGPILCPAGWGFQLFGLNVQTVLDCGNFDKRLHSFGEDAELARNGISVGIPWRVHCDVKTIPIGKRYDPGGIGARFKAREDRTEAERECMAIIHRDWPEYTNTPDKRVRMAWQKMLSDYIPNWKSQSAIHGGRLE